MQKRVEQRCLYGFEEIVADVAAGLQAAVDRMIAGGIDPSKITKEGLDRFQMLLCNVIDVTAWSVKKDGRQIRWNRRAIKLFSEVLVVGYLARNNYDEPPMTSGEIREFLLQLSKMANSATHCNAAD